MSSSDTYGQVTPTNFGNNNLTTTYKNAIGLTDTRLYGNNTTVGNQGGLTQNPNDANFHFSNYLNNGSTVRGIRVVNNTSTDTMNVNFLNANDESVVRTDVTNYTLNNIPRW